MKLERKGILICLSVFLLIVAIGCGGGTRGSGGLIIEGRILTAEGEPLVQASVTSLETGDAATSDDSGRFVLETDLIVGEPHFLIETPTLQITSTGGTIAEDAEIVTVVITVETRGEPSATQTVSTKKKKNSSSSSSSSSKHSSSSSQSSSSTSSSSSSSDDDSDGSGDDDDDDGSSSSSSSSSAGSSSSSSSQQRVEVEGAIQAIAGATVTVEGYTFTVNGETDFGNRDSLSEFSAGERVEARGSYEQGVLIAEKVRLKR